MYTLKTTINDEEVSVNVKNCLDITEAATFANEIISNINDSIDVNGLLFKDLLIKSCTLKYYTDFKIPVDIEEQYNIIYNSSLYEDTIYHDGFNITQYQALIEGIDQQIKFEIQKVISKTKLDELLDTVIGIVKKFDENLDVAKVGNILDKLQKVDKFDEKVLVETILSSQKPIKKNKKVAV